MNDVSAALDGLETNLTVTRREAGAYDANGYWVPGTAQQLTIAACVQPASGEELKMLFSGADTREAIKIHTKTPLQIANPLSQVESDRLLYDGRYYEVTAVYNWIDHGGYQRAFAVLEGAD